MNLSELKSLLDSQLALKNTDENLSANADPLQVARLYKDPIICLICALFAYGNAKLIVKFLLSLDFSWLNSDDEQIKKEIISRNLLYRFQTPQDVAQIFITAKRLRDLGVEKIIKRGFSVNSRIIDGVNSLVKSIYELNSYKSVGYEFFFSRTFLGEPKSPYKRYNMWLRWMVRNSDIDLGYFKTLSPSALILPLDTHTHKVSLALGLCSRKSYDFKVALEITERLREFDPFDPIKYDFAIYRLGQSGEIKSLMKN